MGRAAEIARQIRWYWGTLMGDNHYQRYVEHRRRTHPSEPVMSEREYWRMKHDARSPIPTPAAASAYRPADQPDATTPAETHGVSLGASSLAQLDRTNTPQK